MWVSQLLDHSVWLTDSGHHVVKTKAPGDDAPIRVTLMKEWEGVYEVLFYTWPGDQTHTAMPPGSRKLRTNVPRSGARYFWVLPDFQDSFNFISKSLQASTWIKTQMKRTWRGLFEAHGLPRDHIWEPYVRGRIEVDFGKRYQTWAISTAALLMWLAYNAKMVQEPVDAAKVRGSLRNMIRWNLGRPFTVHSDLTLLGKPDIPNPAAALFHFEDCKLRAVTGAGQCAITKQYGGKAVDDILMDTVKRPRCTAFFGNLCHGLGRAIEDGFTDEVYEPPDIASLAPRPHRRGDREHRALVTAMVGQSAPSDRLAIRIGRGFGLTGLKGAHVHYDNMMARRYLIAGQRLLGACVNFWINPDESRVSGKHWMFNCVYSTDVKMALWAPPQVRIRPTTFFETPNAIFN